MIERDLRNHFWYIWFNDVMALEAVGITPRIVLYYF